MRGNDDVVVRVYYYSEKDYNMILFFSLFFLYALFQTRARILDMNSRLRRTWSKKFLTPGLFYKLFAIAFLAVAWVGPMCLQAQESSPLLDGVEGTDEMSPLFWNRSDLRRTRKSDEEKNTSWSEILNNPPAVQPTADSFQKLFRAFTQGKSHGPRQPLVESKALLSITLEPAQFNLQERREITITLALTNASSRQMRVTFPSAQRVILLLKDGTGKILERWPNDQALEPIEEVVAVNPKETVQFSQRLPTRAMKQLESYTIEASLANNPQYTQTISVRPL